MNKKTAIIIGIVLCAIGVIGGFGNINNQDISMAETIIFSILFIIVGIVLIFLAIKRPEVLTKLFKSKKKKDDFTYHPTQTNINCLEKLNIDISYIKNHQKPTEKQIDYVRRLGISLPEDVTKNDVSCIIAKASGEEAPGLPGTDIVQFALNRKIDFSPYTTKNRFIGAILSSNDKDFNLSFYAYAVYCSLNSVSLGNMDTCSVSHIFTEYAETIKNDERITSSVLSRPYSDYYNPNKSTIAFKNVQEFLMKKIH